MKPFINLSVISMIVMSFSLISCGKDPAAPDPVCNEVWVERTQQVLGYDPNAQALPVLVFNFAQAHLSHQGNGCHGQQPSSDIYLRITNTTAYTMKFDYIINYRMNANSWNYQGFASIPPLGTIDVGRIAGGPSFIDQAGAMINIGSNNIVYE